MAFARRNVWKVIPEICSILLFWCESVHGESPSLPHFTLLRFNELWHLGLVSPKNGAWFPQECTFLAETYPLYQHQRLLASPAPLHATNQEGKCSQKGKTTAGTYYLHPSLNREFLLPVPSPFHTVTESLPCSQNCWSALPQFSTISHCCRTEELKNDALSLTEVTDAQSHLPGILFVTPPKSRQGRGCPAWILHYGGAVLQ